MALRTVITEEDDILRKKAKDVRDFGERTRALLDDMWDTMREYDGIGLAAPQVGILRRALIVDVTERDKEGNRVPTEDGEQTAPPVNTPGGAMFELLNPEILVAEGEGRDKEGCLSVPGIFGFVTRPARIKIRGFARDGSQLDIDAQGLLARAFSHEMDHLDGVLFTDIADEIDDGSGGDGEPDAR